MKRVNKKIHEFITKDFGWKLLSVIIATIMWIFVININQPIDTRTYYKKIVLENAHVLTAQGLAVAEIEDMANTTINIKVKAQRTALDRLGSSADSLVASVDLSSLQTANVGDSISLPLSVNFSDNNINGTYTILSQSPSVLVVKVEELIEKGFPLSVEINGDVTGFGMLSEPQVNVEVIEVLGASSAVDKVDKVVGVINSEKVNLDGYEKVNLKAIDINGNEVKEVTISPTTALVSFYELTTKTIPVNFAVSGIPSSPYEVSNVAIIPNQIDIIGAADIVSNVKSIELPSINVTNERATVAKSFNLSNYLSEGVYITSGQPNYIEVTVSIIGNERKTISLPSNQIQVLNQSSDKLYLIDDNATINIEDKRATLDSMDTNAIYGRINVEGLIAGKHTLPITFIGTQPFSNISGYISILVEDIEYIENLEEEKIEDLEISEDLEDNIIEPELDENLNLEKEESKENSLKDNLDIKENTESELDDNIEEENNDIEENTLEYNLEVDLNEEVDVNINLEDDTSIEDVFSENQVEENKQDLEQEHIETEIEENLKDAQIDINNNTNENKDEV